MICNMTGPGLKLTSVTNLISADIGIDAALRQRHTLETAIRLTNHTAAPQSHNAEVVVNEDTLSRTQTVLLCMAQDKATSAGVEGNPTYTPPHHHHHSSTTHVGVRVHEIHEIHR